MVVEEALLIYIFLNSIIWDFGIPLSWSSKTIKLKNKARLTFLSSIYSSLMRFGESLIDILTQTKYNIFTKTEILGQ